MIVQFDTNKKGKRKLRRIFFVTMIVSSVIWLWVGLKNDLCVTKYSITQKITQKIRIVQLTDLHNAEFGENNSELVELVSSQNPDLIFMTGDMLNGVEENTEIVTELIRNLIKVAPVYFSYGNHEVKWERRFPQNLKVIFEEAGAIVLEMEYQDVDINGNKIRIGGYYGYYGYPEMVEQSKEKDQAELDFSYEFEDTERYKILLCHLPTTWLDLEKIDGSPVDLVFTGHYHGGQVKLPFVGGVFSPNVGLFPEYTEGIFEGDLATCVLSTGLGSSTWIPRFYNPPEVVVIDSIPE